MPDTLNFFITKALPFFPILERSSTGKFIILSILSARSKGSFTLHIYPFELFNTTSLQPRLSEVIIGSSILAASIRHLGTPSLYEEGNTKQSACNKYGRTSLANPE